MNKHTVIIGYGNVLRGDDGLGLVVADCLATVLADKDVKILTVHQLTPELAEPASQAGLIIFVDASHQGRPGSWKREEVEANELKHQSLGHHLTPSRLLACIKAIYKAEPRGLLISVTGKSFECAEKLTPEVEETLPEVVHHICEQVTRFGNASAWTNFA
jgi:hydrogenase maturation protease